MVLKSFTPGKTTAAWRMPPTCNTPTATGYCSGNMNTREPFGKSAMCPGTDYIRLAPTLSYLFFQPAGESCSATDPWFFSQYYYNSSFRKTDNENVLIYSFNFRDQTVLMAGSQRLCGAAATFRSHQQQPRYAGRGTTHRWKAFGLEFFSAAKPVPPISFQFRFGGYYANGTRYNVSADLGYRFQPYVGITLSTVFNQINLPQP